MNATLESLQDKVHSSEWAEGALEKSGTELGDLGCICLFSFFY